MINFSIVLTNSLGLHARSAAVLVKALIDYNSNIQLTYRNNTVDGKSLMDIISLSALKGAKLDFIVDGPDEEECSNTIKDIITNNFGEDN